MKSKEFPRDDTAFIKAPINWPRYPFLPLKRRKNGEWEHGVLWIGTGLTTVRIATIYDLPTIKEEFLALPEHKYDTVEALVADGWLVD